MSVKLPISPQMNQSNQLQESIYRSLKVEKSRNSIIEQNDDSVTILKQKTHQAEFSHFHDVSINQRNSPNDTNILQRKNCIEVDQENVVPISSESCCYCGDTTDLILICQCSMAHQKCANQYLKKGDLLTQLQCLKCKELRHISTRAKLEFKQWKQCKLMLFFDSLFLLLIIGALVALIYFTIVQFYQDISSNRLMLTFLVFSFTVGFILVICMTTKILMHFKTIQFIVKRYDPKNSNFNKNYVNMFLQI